MLFTRKRLLRKFQEKIQRHLKERRKLQWTAPRKLFTVLNMVNSKVKKMWLETNKPWEKNRSKPSREILNFYFTEETFMSFWLQLLSKQWNLENKSSFLTLSAIFWSENCLTYYRNWKKSWRRKSSKNSTIGNSSKLKKTSKTFMFTSGRNLTSSEFFMKVFITE